MPLLIVCFVLFFGVAELLPAAGGMALPTPLIWAAGLLLAIASNYHKPAGLPWRAAQPPTQAMPQAPDKPVPQSPPLPTPKAEPVASHLADLELRPRPSISFIIRKANQQKSAS